jgi:hypothetical protein
MVGTLLGKSVRPAKVSIGQELVVVTIPPLGAGDSITSIAYAYEAYAQCCLYNSNGLPMGVFNYELFSDVTKVDYLDY